MHQTPPVGWLCGETANSETSAPLQAYPLNQTNATITPSQHGAASVLGLAFGKLDEREIKPAILGKQKVPEFYLFIYLFSEANGIKVDKFREENMSSVILVKGKRVGTWEKLGCLVTSRQLFCWFSAQYHSTIIT